MVRLKRLDDDRGGAKVAATDATDNLGQEVEGFFATAKIWEHETRVGLDDANRGEIGEIEAFCDGLGADDDVYRAGFYVSVKMGKGFVFLVISVKTGDICGFEQFF